MSRNITMNNVLSNLLGGKKNGSAEYKEGYEAAEKKYKKLATERDIAINQLNNLGYKLGERPDPLHSASQVKKYCKSQIDCNSCLFYSQTGCILSGNTPSEWKIMA